MDADQGQADEETGSTPDPSIETPSHEESGASQPSVETTTEKRAPSVEAKVDRDAEALARLDEGESKESVRQNPTPVDPSPGQSTQQRRSAAEKGSGQAGSVRPEDTYAGVDPKGLDALRRAQLLPDEETWAAMSQKTKEGLAATARRVIQAQGRISQQMGQQRQQAAAPDESEPLEEEVDGTVNPPPREPADAGRRDVRAQTQSPARAQALPAALDETLKPFTEYFGDDVAKPVRELFASQQQAYTQLQQHNQQLSQQMNVMAVQMFMPQERAGLETLEAEAGKIAPAQRELILQNANHFFEASARAQQPISWQQAVETAGRAILNPNIRQQAQLKLTDRRSQSLRATPSRGQGSTRPDRALSKDDRDSRAMALLDAGRTAGEVRSALY